jgi:hypothetical protein
MFSARAEANDTQWLKRWDWSGGAVPANESCLKVNAQMSWKVDGNCNNFNPLTAAMAKTFAHSNLVINSAPDNAGDDTGDGEWSGQKREGDTWSGGLKLDWKEGKIGGGVTLTWSPDPTDEWLSGLTTKSHQYRQNLKNRIGGFNYSYIWTEICLLSEVDSAADTNAFQACSETVCHITKFELTPPS